MRIAFVTELFSPSVGGQEIRYLELGRHLVRKGHAVHVFTIRLTSGHPAVESLDRIEVQRIVDGFHYRRTGRIRRNPFDIFKFTLRLLQERKVLKDYDAVVFNIWPVLAPMVVPRLVRTRSVIDWCEIRGSRFWDVVNRLLANPKVFHTAVSDSVADQLKGLYNVPSHRIRTILSGVDAAQYHCDGAVKRNRTVLYLGRMSIHKNPLLLLRSFLSAELHRKNYVLHMAGTGPLLSEVRRESADTPNIFVHGEVSEDDKLRLLKESTLLVLPSRREGFPRVVAEAAAAGTPTLTVSYPGNGTASVVHQYGLGWVCTPELHEIAAGVERHARMSEEWLTLSAHCAATAQKHFDWDSVTTALVDFLRGTS